MKTQALTGVELLIMAVISVMILAALLLAPYFEMKTFNKFSSTKATYFDALFSNLRVTPD